MDPDFCPANNKNAIETPFLASSSPRKSMGGIVIDILEKSNFFGSFGSQKGAKNFYSGRALKAPPEEKLCLWYIFVIQLTQKI